MVVRRVPRSLVRRAMNGTRRRISSATRSARTGIRATSARQTSSTSETGSHGPVASVPSKSSGPRHAGRTRASHEPSVPKRNVPPSARGTSPSRRNPPRPEEVSHSRASPRRTIAENSARPCGGRATTTSSAYQHASRGRASRCWIGWPTTPPISLDDDEAPLAFRPRPVREAPRLAPLQVGVPLRVEPDPPSHSLFPDGCIPRGGVRTPPRGRGRATSRGSRP